VPVLQVVDGDTIVVMINRVPELVQLIGVDAPEIGEEGWERATQLTRGLIGQANGFVHLSSAGVDRDALGRLRRCVWLDQGHRLLSDLIVGAGRGTATEFGDVCHGNELSKVLPWGEELVLPTTPEFEARVGVGEVEAQLLAMATLGNEIDDRVASVRRDVGTRRRRIEREAAEYEAARGEEVTGDGGGRDSADIYSVEF
jgi:hypothetical protein